MIPVGRGQRELVIGDRQTGKSTVCIDTILNQKNFTMQVNQYSVSMLYWSKKLQRLLELLKKLEEKGGNIYTVIVAANALTQRQCKFIPKWQVLQLRIFPRFWSSSFNCL